MVAVVRPRPLPSRRGFGAAVGDASVVVVDADASVAVDGDVGDFDGGGGKKTAVGCSKPWPKTPSMDN